jgi:hypothetical protein
MANFAYDFLFPPAIELLGTVVPKVNYTLHGASHDAVIYELKNLLRLLQRRHFFAPVGFAIQSFSIHQEAYEGHEERTTALEFF